MQKSKVSKIISNELFSNMNIDITNDFVMSSSVLNYENTGFKNVDITYKKPKKIDNSIELYE